MGLCLKIEKRGFMVIDESAEMGKSPALWSTNSSLLALAQSYFEMLWFTSVEYYPIKEQSIKVSNCAKKGGKVKRLVLDFTFF